MRLNPEKSFLVKLLAVWLLAGAGICYGAAAQSDPLSGRAPLTDRELDDLRGGFVTAQGISIQIGYEQLSNLEGVLHPTLSISPENIAKLASDGATDVARTLGASFNSTGGSGARILPLDTVNSYLTLIQNGSSNKTIGVVNVFDISIKNLSSIANQGVEKFIQYQLIQSLR